MAKRLVWPKTGSKMGLFSLAGSRTKVGRKWVFGALFLHKIDPETHFRPTFGPLPANEKTHFDPLLRQMNCLTILAMRDL